MSLRNVSNVLVGSCAIEREAEIEIGPGYFKKLAQAIKARRLAASVAFAAQKAELFEARLVAMQVAFLTSSKDSFSDDSDGDELDEDEVAQIKARARLDNMLVPKVDQEYLSDDVNDDSSSDESKPEYEDDAAITYLTHGIEGEVLKDRIARKFRQLCQSFAAAVVVQEQHVGTPSVLQPPFNVLADAGDSEWHQMGGLDGAVVDVAAVVKNRSYYGDREYNDATLVQRRLLQTKGRRQHCTHGGKFLHSSF